MSAPIHIVRGSDPVAVADRLDEVLDGLLDGRARRDVVEELSGDDYECAAVVLGAASVSMFGDRVIVARNAARFGSDELAPLLRYLEDPNPTSTIVLVWEKAVSPSAKAKPFPKKLGDAAKAAGGVVHTADPPTQAKQRDVWLSERLASSNVALLPNAKHLIGERFGEDVSRIGGVLNVLEASFPAGTKLSADDIEPYLGDGGSVPPWDLTDAIDKGDVPVAVDALQRMIRGGRHPLQVMATLQTHY